VNPKICLLGINPPNKCSKFLCHLSLFCCRKEIRGYAKVIHKKRRKKEELRKNGRVSKIFKTMGT
jgi:hypothetical protein